MDKTFQIKIVMFCWITFCIFWQDVLKLKLIYSHYVAIINSLNKNMSIHLNKVNSLLPTLYQLCTSAGSQSVRKRKVRFRIPVSITGPLRGPLNTDVPSPIRCGTLKNPHCSMAISAEHWSKYAALHRQWSRLHMSEKFMSGTKNPKQTNKPIV